VVGPTNRARPRIRRSCGRPSVARTTNPAKRSRSERALSITTGGLASGITGEAYSQTLEASVTRRVTWLLIVVLAPLPFRTVGVSPPPAMLIVTEPPESL